MKEEIRNCQNCQKDFKIEIEDFEFYEKMKVPAPTWCPDCRAKRRMSFYNVNSLKKRTCDKCEKNIISIYGPDTKFPVYCPACWWADDWDASEYAMDYDFEKTFLEQFKELDDKVPKLALETDFLKSINSSYTNACGALKNCYLVFVGSLSEDTMYSMKIDNLKNSLDCTNTSSIENSYQLYNCNRMYNSSFCLDCNDCVNIYFSKDLKNCQNCFGCVNLRNASYQIFNQQYSKEDYQNKIKEMNLGSFKNIQKIQEKTKEMFLKFPVKYIHGYKNMNVTGDYIFNSKNVKDSNGIIGGENVKFSQMTEMPPLKDCYDYTNWGQGANNIYETVGAGEGINNLKFVNRGWNSYDIEYSYNSLMSNNHFGCVFLRKKSYCILNKQYSKTEYFETVEKIKKQMNDLPYTDKQGNVYKYGEFFPPELSPFAYNETIAQEYFPLTKEEALEQGYSWKDREKRDYQVTLKTEDIPDDIKDVDNNITKEVIECATTAEDREKTNCTEAFKIIPSELEFYKKMNIPLPRYCPNCRHHQRLQNRNPLKLYTRTCMKEGCSNEFETTYAPDRPEIVYCEGCYQNEVV